MKALRQNQISFSVFHRDIRTRGEVIFLEVLFHLEDSSSSGFSDAVLIEELKYYECLGEFLIRSGIDTARF
jgi:hypothetical protein